MKAQLRFFIILCNKTGGDDDDDDDEYHWEILCQFCTDQLVGIYVLCLLTVVDCYGYK